MTKRSRKSRVFCIERLEHRWTMDAVAPIGPPVIPAENAVIDVSLKNSVFKTLRSGQELVSKRSIASTARMDVNQDDVLTSRDILAVINALGRSEEASERLDINNDGRVSALDALLIVNELERAGGQFPLLPVSEMDFDAQRSDAVNFVSNFSSNILPDVELVDLVARDFAQITASYSDLGIRVFAPTPGSILVYLTDEARAAFDAGNFDRLDELNAELSVESITRNEDWGNPRFSRLILTFSKPYRWDYLAERYAAVAGVSSVNHPTFSKIGGPYGIAIADPRANDGARVYEFQFGSVGCPAGCLQVDIISIRVTDESVERFEDAVFSIVFPPIPIT